MFIKQLIKISRDPVINEGIVTFNTLTHHISGIASMPNIYIYIYMNILFKLPAVVTII